MIFQNPRSARATNASPLNGIPTATEISEIFNTFKHRFIPIIPRKSLRYLTGNPLRCRVCCDIDPDEVSAFEADDDEGIEQVEANGRDNEQIHGGNVRRVITQEGPPSLTGRSTPLDHVVGNASLGDRKPELKQLTVDARRAPKRVFDAHPPDQCAKVRIDLRPPSQ